MYQLLFCEFEVHDFISLSQQNYEEEVISTVRIKKLRLGELKRLHPQTQSDQWNQLNSEQNAGSSVHDAVSSGT